MPGGPEQKLGLLHNQASRNLNLKPEAQDRADSRPGALRLISET
jgi:hypothetical protein